jgi:hypothetical protein
VPWERYLAENSFSYLLPFISWTGSISPFLKDKLKLLMKSRGLLSNMELSDNSGRTVREADRREVSEA